MSTRRRNYETAISTPHENGRAHLRGTRVQRAKKKCFADFNFNSIRYRLTCVCARALRWSSFNAFSAGRCVFVLFRIFDFLKIYFCFFLMIESRYFNRMGIIRKRIKIPIFSKKKNPLPIHWPVASSNLINNKNYNFCNNL